MAEINVRNETDIEGGFFIEGVPGAGLASKIAADHVIDALEMELYATVSADGLPEVMIFEEGSRHLRPPVRIFADEDTGLYVLTSDILISPVNVDDFAECVVDWLADNGITPLLLSGLPADVEESSLYGVVTGDGDDILAGTDIALPRQTGLVGGPTGAVMYTIAEREMDGACLVVETDPQFPDPEAAKTLLERGVEPIVGFDVDTEVLMDRRSRSGTRSRSWRR